MEQVADPGQEQLADTGRELGHVRVPSLIRNGRYEVALKEIGEAASFRSGTLPLHAAVCSGVDPIWWTR